MKKSKFEITSGNCKQIKSIFQKQVKIIRLSQNLRLKVKIFTQKKSKFRT